MEATGPRYGLYVNIICAIKYRSRKTGRARVGPGPALALARPDWPGVRLTPGQGQGPAKMALARPGPALGQCTLSIPWGFDSRRIRIGRQYSGFFSDQKQATGRAWSFRGRPLE
jgi:hypothetical protein